MNFSRFYTNLAITIGISFLVCALFDYFLVLREHYYFLGGSLIIFILLSVSAFIFGFQATKSDNKYTFSRFSLLHTFVKLILVVLVVLVYSKNIETESNVFIWPFISMYIIFTIFETHFLLKLARL